MASMLASRLYLPKLKLDESQNDILGLSLKYKSPTTS